MFLTWWKILVCLALFVRRCHWGGFISFFLPKIVRVLLALECAVPVCGWWPGGWVDGAHGQRSIWMPGAAHYFCMIRCFLSGLLQDTRMHDVFTLFIFHMDLLVVVGL